MTLGKAATQSNKYPTMIVYGWPVICSFPYLQSYKTPSDVALSLLWPGKEMKTSASAFIATHKFCNAQQIVALFLHSASSTD